MDASPTSYSVVFSAGLGFSNLVYRTYANTPQVQNGAPVLNSSGNALCRYGNGHAFVRASSRSLGKLPDSRAAQASRLVLIRLLYEEELPWVIAAQEVARFQLLGARVTEFKSRFFGTQFALYEIAAAGITWRGLKPKIAALDEPLQVG